MFTFDLYGTKQKNSLTKKKKTYITIGCFVWENQLVLLKKIIDEF